LDRLVYKDNRCAVSRRQWIGSRLQRESRAAPSYRSPGANGGNRPGRLLARVGVRLLRRVAAERRAFIPRLSHAPDDSSIFNATSGKIEN